MFYSKDETEVCQLVTTYSKVTCIYFSILLISLAWTNGMYSIGKYKFHSVLIIIIVAEMIKYFASAIHLKITDVNLSKKHEDKSVFSVVKSFFAKGRIKEGFKTIITVAIMTSVYFVIAVLFGAEIFEKHEETLMFSLLLSVLTIFPTCINLGSHSIVLLLLGSKPSDKLESLIYQNLYFTIFGAWIGAFVIPLDWDRPWQEWPIPCSSGAMMGFLLSHVYMMFEIKFGSKKKTKKSSKNN